MVSKIKTFWNLPLSHKWIFIQIATLVPLVQLGIKTVKFKRTFRILQFFQKRRPANPANRLKTVRRYQNYLNLFHKQFPFLGKCLAGSLALWFLLRRKGIETELRFGVKKEDEKLLAHSWIEYRGKLLETQNSYVPFPGSILEEVGRLNK
ncbi:MAG: lasso peptide biosynthesis B2 protein [Pyrinomonadaceae bacterium]